MEKIHASFKPAARGAHATHFPTATWVEECRHAHELIILRIDLLVIGGSLVFGAQDAV